MSVATTGYLSCLYRSDPVRAAFCRWHRNTRFCAHRAQENKCHWHATDSARNVAIPVTRDLAKPYRKVTHQIPIARLLILTAWLRPAVSSLEACKTPAR
jgi:hypothetical protein